MNHKQVVRLGRTFAGAALILIAGACNKDDTPGHTEASATVVRGVIAGAERTEIPIRTQLFGTVEADKTAAVSARVMATVTAMKVVAGDTVRAGEVVALIDPQAAEGQLAQATGAETQARAALSLAERNYERFKALAEANAASELELDMARMQYEQASGAVEQAKGAVQAATSVAGDSRVRAPFAGRVVRTMVDVGDLAAPGRPLLVIQSEGSQRLTISVPEQIMTKTDLVTGDLIDVTVDTRSDLGALKRPIVEIAPAADPASHSFQMKIDLSGDGFSSGASGRAWIDTGNQSAVLAPASAIVHQGGLSWVVVRTDAGTASARVVTLGEPAGDDQIVVLSGLRGGESLVLDIGALPPAGAIVEESR